MHDELPTRDDEHDAAEDTNDPEVPLFAHSHAPSPEKHDPGKYARAAARYIEITFGCVVTTYRFFGRWIGRAAGSPNFWIAIATIAIAIATGIYTHYARLQWEAMERQARISEATLIATERAYVNVQDVTVVIFEAGKTPEAVISYKNTGLTPARNAFVIPSSFIDSTPILPRINSHWNGCIGDLPPQIRGSMGSLIPPGITREVSTLGLYFGWDFVDNGQQRNGIITNMPLDAKDFEAVRRGLKNWWVVAYISYRDHFSGCHSSAEPFYYDFPTRTMKPSRYNWKEYDSDPN